jgi:NAD(P)-dependent dehydrogenase (short-subunit alcohol dehydrogenase family)
VSDKIVLVTGAAQGIGKAYARRVAQSGSYVILADINAEKVTEAAKDLAGEGLAVSAERLDVSSQESCQALAQRINDGHGRLDGLVNNAAIFSTIEMKPFWELSIPEWDTLMAVNLRGPWLLTSALLPALRKSDSASIVNVGSDSLWLGRGGYLHYVASKAGVYGMTHSMAHELGEFGIRVNTLSPGPVFTEVDRGTVTDAQKEGMRQAQALKRLADPDDMVGVVAFLLSDDSRWMTGQTFHVNGGLLHR